MSKENAFQNYKFGEPRGLPPLTFRAKRAIYGAGLALAVVVGGGINEAYDNWQDNNAQPWCGVKIEDDLQKQEIVDRLKSAGEDIRESDVDIYAPSGERREQIADSWQFIAVTTHIGDVAIVPNINYRACMEAGGTPVPDDTLANYVSPVTG